MVPRWTDAEFFWACLSPALLQSGPDPSVRGEGNPHQALETPDHSLLFSGQLGKGDRGVSCQWLGGRSVQGDVPVDLHTQWSATLAPVGLYAAPASQLPQLALPGFQQP